ncbi:uncharacterized protein BDV17DRAFT_290193 [Aspergillus undulatus]|uniref:uncharacterized protein n=1 Tax=Aspergillus undulatus TaxID=1810928 RepID=UPI003CCE3F95
MPDQTSNEDLSDIDYDELHSKLDGMIETVERMTREIQALLTGSGTRTRRDGEGNCVLDAHLYESGVRDDVDVYEELYGLKPAEVLMICKPKTPTLYNEEYCAPGRHFINEALESWYARGVINFHATDLAENAANKRKASDAYDVAFKDFILELRREGLEMSLDPLHLHHQVYTQLSTPPTSTSSTRASWSPLVQRMIWTGRSMRTMKPKINGPKGDDTDDGDAEDNPEESRVVHLRDHVGDQNEHQHQPNNNHNPTASTTNLTPWMPRWQPEMELQTPSGAR